MRNDIEKEIERLEKERDGLVGEDWAINEILDRIDAIDGRIFKLKLQCNDKRKEKP